MKLLSTLMICLALALFGAGPAVGQQPPQEHSATSQQQPAPKPGAPAQGDQAHQMHQMHMQHMEMCRQMMMGQPNMMGGGMGTGMMRDGMMGIMPMMTGGDPKQQAEMMAMRGEMMKAMGDIMMKYAHRMQSAK
jgi:hypothetical protein